jgi:hypothetical protein
MKIAAAMPEISANGPSLIQATRLNYDRRRAHRSFLCTWQRPARSPGQMYESVAQLSHQQLRNEFAEQHQPRSAASCDYAIAWIRAFSRDLWRAALFMALRTFLISVRIIERMPTLSSRRRLFWRARLRACGELATGPPDLWERQRAGKCIESWR